MVVTRNGATLSKPELGGQSKKSPDPKAACAGASVGAFAGFGGLLTVPPYDMNMIEILHRIGKRRSALFGLALQAYVCIEVFGSASRLYKVRQRYSLLSTPTRLSSITLESLPARGSLGRSKGFGPGSVSVVVFRVLKHHVVQHHFLWGMGRLVAMVSAADMWLGWTFGLY